MNIFQKIGNKIERDSKNKKEVNENYWKLKPIERIDYDLKEERIRKENTFNVFDVLVGYIKLILYIGIFYIVMSVITGVDLIESGLLLIKSLLSLFPVIFILGLFLQLWAEYNIMNRLEKLNDKFKLR